MSDERPDEATPENKEFESINVSQKKDTGKAANKPSAKIKKGNADEADNDNVDEN